MDSELRFDLLSGRQVLIVPNRDQRPNEYLSQIPASRPGECAFCAGNESQTPPPIATYPEETSASAPWIVRVVPNKFPVVRPASGNQTTPGQLPAEHPIAGVHELVIESPRHVGSFSALSKIERTTAIRAYRDRYRDLSRRGDLQHIQIFKNNGAAAGASIEHVHSQIIALNFVPPSVKRRQRLSSEFADQSGRSLLQLAIEDETAAGRVAIETSRLSAYCPYASSFPYECIVAPRNAATPFSEIDDATIDEIADTLQRLVAGLEAFTTRPAYNFVLHTPPLSDSANQGGWYFQLCPRLNQFAGFEWGTDLFINTITPERAAEHYREAIASQT